MVEEHIAGVSDTVPRRSAAKVALVIIVLLVVAVAVNWNSDLGKAARGEQTLRSAITGKPDPVPGMQGMSGMSGGAFAFPDPVGPEDAKIQVHVGAVEGDGCHRPLVALWLAIGKLEPERLRVEFHSPTNMPPIDGQPVEFGCMSGTVVNGQSKFEIPQAGDKRVVHLEGPPGAHGWGPDEVVAIVNAELEEHYGAAGELTTETLTAAIQEIDKDIPVPEGGAAGAGKGPAGGPPMPGMHPPGAMMMPGAKAAPPGPRPDEDAEVPELRESEAIGAETSAGQ